MLSIKIQKNNFDPGFIYNSIARDRKDIGAKVAFTGIVRDFSGSNKVTKLDIEYYPLMAEKQLNKICQRALEKWDINEIHLIHRYGPLKPGDNIVNLVLVSQNRDAAFEGGRFIMDYLKSNAPFWKKEHYDRGSAWVDQNPNDLNKMKSW